MHTPVTLPEVGAAIRETLSGHLVMSREGLIAQLQQRGVDLGTEPVDVLEEVLETDEVGVVMLLAGGRITYLPALLDGRTFTHRLTDAEVAHGFIETGADLHCLTMLTEDARYQRLRDGSALTDVLTGFDDDVLRDRGIADDAIADAAWLLAPDALQAWTAGDLLGVTVHPDGFALSPVTPGQPPADFAERVAAAITQDAGDQPAMLDSVMWELCAEDATLFVSPLPPLGALLDERGFVQEGDQLAPPGFDLPGWRAGQRGERTSASTGSTPMRLLPSSSSSGCTRLPARRWRRRENCPTCPAPPSRNLGPRWTWPTVTSCRLRWSSCPIRTSPRRRRSR